MRVFVAVEFAQELKDYLQRKFTPHITLAREVVHKEPVDQLMDNILVKPQEIFVDKISLMESSRIKGKLTYSPLYAASLKQAYNSKE